MMELAIDIETFSSVDLKKCGVYKYVESPDFQILMISWSYDGGKVYTLDLTRNAELPLELLEALISFDVLKTAYNANFERTCLGKHTGYYMFPNQWECTMVRAGSLGLPMSLEKTAQVMGLNQQKDNAGKALIRYFSVPCKPTKANGMRTRNLPHHDPVKWKQYLSYNAQDVRAELAIRYKLRNLPLLPSESKLWALDQRINDAGVMLDTQLMHNAIELDEQYKDELIAEAVELTGLQNPNSVKQLVDWLDGEMEDDVTTLNKKAIPELIEKAPNEIVKRVLELRQLLSKTSVKKYIAMRNGVCADDHIRGTMQFGGANRTMRWAGRLVQVHNLPRTEIDKVTLDFCREAIKQKHFDLLKNTLSLLGYDVPYILSQLIRTAFIAPEGYTFGVLDFSAIEARVIAWLAGEQWRIDVFETHGKIYEASAAKMFKIPLESVTKDSPYRQRGKVSELALGYQGGVNALITMGALEMGIPEEELQGLVDKWRSENPAIVAMWWAVQDAAINAVLKPGETFNAAKCKFYAAGNMLYVELPSGRKLAYVRPKAIAVPKVFVEFTEDTGKFKKGKKTALPIKEAGELEAIGVLNITSEAFNDYNLQYEGMDQTTKKWGTQHTYGGKLVENITQAIARDCLGYAMLRLDAEGFHIVMHVHDETVLKLSKSYAKERLMYANNLMSENIPWAPGLQLKVDGFITDYYKKD